MRVTIKRQVPIPQHLREKTGIAPAIELDLITRDISRYGSYFQTVKLINP
jgi:bifunctional DNA-binding transcriptional regulator/antitoxin component of YhaV-PrlF toxin-antitoxin module